MNERQHNCVQKHGMPCHEHLRGAERVGESQSHPHVSHYILCTVKCHQLGWSAGELLQCLAVISVSLRLPASLKGQNKHSKCLLFKSSLHLPALFKLFVLSAAAHLGAITFSNVQIHCLNQLLRCTTL